MRKTIAAIALLTCAVALGEGAGGGEQPVNQPASVTADFTGRTGEFSVAGPGLTRLLGGFSATVEIGGRPITLSSLTGGKLEGTPLMETEQTPFGPAKTITCLLNFAGQGVTIGLRLGTVPGEGIVLLRPFLKNTGQAPVRLFALSAIRAGEPSEAGGLVLNGDGWLLTSLDSTSAHDGNPVSVLDLPSFKERNVPEYGGLYRPDGTGFLFAPVGEPTAYLTTRLAPAFEAGYRFSIASKMSGITVDPGETREGQEVALWFRPPREVLPKWADWNAASHHARHDKEPLSGWCSWYYFTSKITGTDVLGVVDEVLKQSNRLRPQVVQIDDGYQNLDGVWDANEKFPGGMEVYAKKIAATGARPGLWIAPTMVGIQDPWLNDPKNRETVWDGKFFKESKVRPDDAGYIDPTHPRAREKISHSVRHVVESGFTYLKFDKNEIGSKGWFNKKLTSFQIMRELYQDIRNAAGEGTYIMACHMEPNRAVVGLADSSRSGYDAHRHPGGIRLAMDDVLRSFHLNRRWMAMDNDVYYMAPDVKGVEKVAGGLDLHRTWLSMMGLSSGAALTSDPWHWPQMKDHIRTVEIMQPPANEQVEVLDLCTAREWPRIASLVKRPWGTQAVVLLWNPGTEPRTVDLQLSETGLDPTKTHAVWSFWDDQFIGLAKGSWTTPALQPTACQYLVFTPVDLGSDQPVLIGSNLHIHAGAAEIAEVTTNAEKIQIDLTDAGAREGDLFLWSKTPLKMVSSTGVDVIAVENAGDNVQKVHVRGRKSGQPQSIVLTSIPVKN